MLSPGSGGTGKPPGRSDFFNNATKFIFERTLPMMAGLVFTDAESRIPVLPGKHLSFVPKDRGTSFFITN
jgi:hypothetical protein